MEINNEDYLKNYDPFDVRPKPESDIPKPDAIPVELPPLDKTEIRKPIPDLPEYPENAPRPVEGLGNAGNATEKPAEKTEDVLGSESKNFFGRMSEKARDIANSAYEGLYKIPGVNRVVGKMEIGYKQFWADKHEEKAAQYKAGMDSIDLKLVGLEKSKQAIALAVESLQKQGMPGSELISLKIKEFDRERDGYLSKKDKLQSRLETRQDKVKMYTNERDVVAGRLIEYYDGKLEPMEKGLELLASRKGEADLDINVTELRHREHAEQLSVLEKTRADVAKSLRDSGMEEKDINNHIAVKEIDSVLKHSREEMKKEMAVLDEKKAKIEKKVAKANERANPYRDRREEFVRVTKDRPIKINTKDRVKGEAFDGKEDVNIVNREAPVKYKEPVKAREIIPPGGFMAEGQPSGVEDKAENVDKNIDKRPTLEIFVTGWNMFPKDFPKVDSIDFLKSVKGLSKDFKLNSDEFKGLLKKYYQIKTPFAQPARESRKKFEDKFDAVYATFDKKIKEEAKKRGVK